MTETPATRTSKPSSSSPETQASLAIVPRSQTEILTSNFVTKLNVTDFRYDITTYGEFLKHVPSHLGVNSALDSSVDAFASASAVVYTGKQSVDSLAKYGIAIKALRACLSNPVTRRAPETMCAIYLVMIIQVSAGSIIHAR